MNATELPAWIQVGARAKKTGGDYSFSGEIVAVFQKRSGVWRVVLESDTPGNEGLLFIFNPSQLTRAITTATIAEQLEISKIATASAYGENKCPHPRIYQPMSSVHDVLQCKGCGAYGSLEFFGMVP